MEKTRFVSTKKKLDKEKKEKKEKKYEELYKYSKDLLKEELDRIKALDAKAAMYLSVMGILIGSFSLLGRQVFGDIIPPQSFIQWVVLAFGLLTLAGFIAAAVYLYRVVNQHEVRRLPLKKEVFNAVKEHDIEKIHYSWAVRCRKAFVHNRKTSIRKSNLLKCAYYLIAISLFFLIVFIFSSAVNQWAIKNKLEVKKNSANLAKPRKEVM